MLIALIASLLSSCSENEPATTSAKKAPANNDWVVQLIKENPKVFNCEVPIFNSLEEMECILDKIDDIDSGKELINLCRSFRIDNPDIKKYTDFFCLFDELFPKSYNAMIDELSSDSEEAYKCGEMLIEMGKKHSEFVKITEEEGMLFIEPASGLDLNILRNKDNLLVCGEDVYYFYRDKYQIVPIKLFVENSEKIKEHLAVMEKEMSRKESNEDYKMVRKVRHTSDPVTVKDKKDRDVTYTLKASFYTHYCANIIDNVMEMHNCVWVKNYKRTGKCNVLCKMQNQGMVVFNLDWKEDSNYYNVLDYFKNNDNFKTCWRN